MVIAIVFGFHVLIAPLNLIFKRKPLSETTNNPTSVDEVVGRLQAGAHEVVDKVANATIQATDTLVYCQI